MSMHGFPRNSELIPREIHCSLFWRSLPTARRRGAGCAELGGSAAGRSHLAVSRAQGPGPGRAGPGSARQRPAGGRAAAAGCPEPPRGGGGRRPGCGRTEPRGAPPPRSPARAAVAVFPPRSPSRARRRLSPRLLQPPARGESRGAPAGPRRLPGSAATCTTPSTAALRRPKSRGRPMPGGEGTEREAGRAGQGMAAPGPLWPPAEDTAGRAGSPGTARPGPPGRGFPRGRPAPPRPDPAAPGPGGGAAPPADPAPAGRRPAGPGRGATCAGGRGGGPAAARLNVPLGAGRAVRRDGSGRAVRQEAPSGARAALLPPCPGAPPPGGLRRAPGRPPRVGGWGTGAGKEQPGPLPRGARPQPPAPPPGLGAALCGGWGPAGGGLRGGSLPAPALAAPRRPRAGPLLAPAGHHAEGEVSPRGAGAA